MPFKLFFLIKCRHTLPYYTKTIFNRNVHSLTPFQSVDKFSKVLFPCPQGPPVLRDHFKVFPNWWSFNTGLTVLTDKHARAILEKHKMELQ